MSATVLQPLTTLEVSRHLNVDLSTVINWCNQGKIRSFRTPGGHRRVEIKDFINFISVYRFPVPKEFESLVPRGDLRILIVDDEEPVRKFLIKAIIRHLPQAQIYDARDGFEAGMLLLDVHPHLVVLDLMLPGIDGFRVCSNIRRDGRFINTKILAISGQSTQENKDKIMKAGADGFLAKPFDVAHLIEEVSQLIAVKI